MAKKRLHRLLFADPALQTEDAEAVEGALRRAFAAADAEILAQARQESWKAGAAAACVLCSGGKLHVACLGHVEVVLAQRSGATVAALPLTRKHLACEADEMERLYAAHCLVCGGRLAGDLTVSRAFGDLAYKAPHCGSTDFMSAAPYVQTRGLSAENPFFIIASNGLWDALGHGRAVQLCESARAKGCSPAKAAERLVDEALVERGGSDDVTCIVVYVAFPGKKRD